MVSLKLAWATHEAVKYACLHFHYAKKVPMGKLVKIGVWENGQFVGAVIFGLGISKIMHETLGVEPTQVCELVRVALKKHETPVSRILSIALKMLKRANPKLLVCVSFADPAQGHHGGIYQASNWVYLGKSATQIEIFYEGKWRHKRVIYRKLSHAQIARLAKRTTPAKLKYAIALEESFKKRLNPRARPYIKRAGSRDVAASGNHSEEDSSQEIPALQY